MPLPEKIRFHITDEKILEQLCEYQLHKNKSIT